MAPPGWRSQDLMPQYLEAVRRCLDGSSHLDAYRLHFTTESEIRRFLSVNLADLADPFDQARFRHLHAEAIAYIRRHFGYRIPEAVEHLARPEDLFLAASGDHPTKTQVLACVLLKLMHVINHLDAHSLLRETSIGENELEREVERRLMRAAREMADEGVPLVSFTGNRKGRDALITKLVVKRDTTAADVLDRVRFRLVTPKRDDIVPALAYLMRHVLPFNHTLARASVNNLVDLDAWLADQDGLRQLALELPGPVEGTSHLERLVNEFSSDDYRIVNFVAEVPLRMDLFASQTDNSFTPDLGRITYMQAELQVVDLATSRSNELGDNAHDQYKRRQRQAAEHRLKWGLLRQS
jgi:uncharacterized protein (TIGR04552 family)